MSTNRGSESQDVAKSFQTALNKHGYGFQYRVLAEAARLSEGGESNWKPKVIEFPVAARGRDTRIDLVLSWPAHHINMFSATPPYIVGECKRVDPALKHWCFARAPAYGDPNPCSDFIVEHLSEKGAGGAIMAGGYDTYNIGVEVKSGERGDGVHSGRSAIEDAATQACRGMNGLIEYLGSALAQKVEEYPHGAIVIPVIFTTARLFTTDANLGEVEITTGDIDLSKIPVKEVKRVYLQYHVSVGLKHSYPSVRTSPDLSDVLRAEFVRTIPIVSAGGIEDFLSTFEPYVGSLSDCL